MLMSSVYLPDVCLMPRDAWPCIMSLVLLFYPVAEALAELESLSGALYSARCGDAHRFLELGQAWFLMDAWDFLTHRGMSHNVLLNYVGTEGLHSFRFCSS